MFNKLDKPIYVYWYSHDLYDKFKGGKATMNEIRAHIMRYSKHNTQNVYKQKMDEDMFGDRKWVTEKYFAKIGRMQKIGDNWIYTNELPAAKRGKPVMRIVNKNGSLGAEYYHVPRDHESRAWTSPKRDRKYWGMR